MAVERTIEKAPGSRLVLLTALLSLSAISAAAFGRVFQGSRPTLELMAAAGSAVLLAGALEQRHVVLATAASAVGLAVAIGLLVFHTTTWFGLPTATTLRAAVRAWEAIGQTARTEVAPTPPFAPLFLAGLTAVWVASFSSHALASRARSPFLALLPPAGLLAFTSIILEEGARPLYVVVFLASAIAVLFADGLRRVGQWGPITVWHARRKARLTTSSTTRGARWVALVTLAVAVFLPGILPGYRAQGLVRVHGTQSSAQVVIDPIVQIRPYLRQTQAIPLFTVRATKLAYWRLATLDQFTGKLWTSSNLEATGGQMVRSGPLSPNVRIDPKLGKVISQHFTFERLSQKLLPAASDPVSFDGEEAARYDPESNALVVPGGASNGFTYDVKSSEVIPSEKDLDAIASLDAPGTSRYTRLPAGMPHLTEITDLAKDWTRDATNPYRRVLAIQDRLRSPRYFRYSESVPAGHGADDILHFLTVTRAGYCEQFAGSMAVLLRALGIPARVAVGFTPGIPRATRGTQTTLRVTTQQAHAWVEVLFPQYGWLAFEPTPSRFNSEAAPYAFPVANPPSETGGNRSPEVCVITGPAAHEPQDCTQPASGGKPGAEKTGEPPGSKTLRTPVPAGHKVSGQALIWWGLLGAALLFVAGIPFVKVARRRLVLRRARGASEVVLAAFHVLDDRAADVGLGRWPAETYREYVNRLVAIVKGLDGRMEGLSSLAGRAAYSTGTVSEDQAEEARLAAREAGRTIRRSVGVERRILGSFRVRRP
jgi:hypothetical protein